MLEGGDLYGLRELELSNVIRLLMMYFFSDSFSLTVFLYFFPYFSPLAPNSLRLSACIVLNYFDSTCERDLQLIGRLVF